MAQCAGRVYDAEFRIWRPCARFGNVGSHGIYYCGHHAPGAVEARKKKVLDKDAARYKASRSILAEAKETQRRAGLYDELLACLEWYVQNDETSEGGTWEFENAPYLEGLRRAQAVIAKAKGEQP